jgi:hypothetical protein
MTQPVDLAQDFIKGEAFFFRTSLIPTSYSGLVWKKNADLRGFCGWVISIIAGWFEVIADTAVPIT